MGQKNHLRRKTHDQSIVESIIRNSWIFSIRFPCNCPQHFINKIEASSALLTPFCVHPWLLRWNFFQYFPVGELRISSSFYKLDKTKNIFLWFSTVYKIYHLTHSIFYMYNVKKIGLDNPNIKIYLFFSITSFCHHNKHITGEVWLAFRFSIQPLIIRKKQKI